MAIGGSESKTEADRPSPFDPKTLVSRKPSALPDIYEYVVVAGEATPREIRKDLAVSRSVAHSNLALLCEAGLVERVRRGVYRPATISIEPTTVRALCDLRSKRQFEICELAANRAELDVTAVENHLEMTPSNVRNAVVRLDESGFLEVHREPFENSRKEYRLSEEGERALRSLDAEEYRGWDCQETVAHETGIEGTPFRTAYEVEDAQFLFEADDEWLHPKRVASALGKNAKKAQQRFSKMAERGLLDCDAEAEKMVFSGTRKTRLLFDDLELYRLSNQYALDLYSVATNGSLSAPFTMDELYSALVVGETDVTIEELDGARGALKRAGLIDGNPHTGYNFTVG